MSKRPIVIKMLAAVVAVACSSGVSVTLRAQAAGPSSGMSSAGRVGFEVAAGPGFEVAAAGERASQRAVLGVPTLAIKVTRWLDYTLEGHLSRHVTPVTGNVFGIVPLGFRVHSGGPTQVHLAAGAGVVWTELAGLHGVEQRRNFITQIGAGIARVGANGSGVSLEVRLFHLSNLSATPPNLGMEAVSVLLGYRLPR